MDVQIYINGKNAKATWRVGVEDGALSALLTPPPMKPFVSNKSPRQHGKEIYPANPRVDERDVQIPIYFSARSEAEFLANYESFVAELQTGVFTLRVVAGGLDRTFFMVYLSCQQFTQMNLGLAKFLLRLNEPNPTKKHDDNDLP